MEKEQLLIQEFMKKINQPVRTYPTTDVSFKEIMLRIKLIAGEFNELIDAISNKDIVKIADAIVDMIYVLKGTANTFGIDLEEIFDEVHRSNLTKSIGKIVEDPSGKVLKSKYYSPPDISNIIKKQINNKKYEQINSNTDLGSDHDFL